MSILDIRNKIWIENQYNHINYIPYLASIKYVYDENFNYPLLSRTLNISVIKKDSIVASYNYINPLILSFADNEVPGGCINAACGNQEESIFRRTTIHKHLPIKLYPIKDNEAIYSSFVKIIYEDEDNLYKKLDKKIYTSFVSCPGLKFPALKDNYTLYENDIEILEKKIELILQIAIINDHSTLILGPLGCGAYGTPIKEVAKIFKKIILLKCNNSFERIIFACLGNSYNIFNDVFNE